MRPPGWVLAVVAAAVAVAVADGALLLATRGGTPAARADDRLRTGHVLVVDAAKGRVVDRIDVGHLPTGLVTQNGGVWVLNRGDGTLTHLDARSHRALATVTPEATASDITAGGGAIWIAGPPRGRRLALEIADLERLDPKTGALVRSFRTATGASALAAGGGAVWSTGYLGHGVRGAARSDAVTGAMRPVDLGIYGDLIAANDTAAYWVGSIASRVARVSTRTGKVTASLPLASDASVAAGHLPPNPTDVALGNDAVWISTTNGTVVRLDAQLHGVVARIPVCGNALALAYGLGAVWVGCADDTLVRVDPHTDAVGKPIPLDGVPRSVAAGEGSVWVSVQ